MDQTAPSLDHNPGRYCRGCSHDLRASEKRCPECGRPFDSSDPRTYRRRPPGKLLRWLLFWLAGLLLLALPPALTLGWLWQGWHEEQKAFDAGHWAYSYQHGVTVTMRDSKHTSVQMFLPQRLVYLCDRAAVVESVGATDTDIAGLSHFKFIRSFHPGRVSVIGSSRMSILLELVRLTQPSVQSSDPQLSRWLGYASARIRSGTADQITDAGLAYLAHMTKMQELWLPNTPITDAGLAHLAGMTQMTTLDLSQTAVTDAGLAHLTGMTQMEYLFLWQTGITGAGLNHLAGMTHLKGLILADTPLTDTAIEPLAAHPTLQFLDLRRTGLSEAGFSRLRAALPSTAIAR
jgi:hypothetical protein